MQFSLPLGGFDPLSRVATIANPITQCRQADARLMPTAPQIRFQRVPVARSQQILATSGSSHCSQSIARYILSMAAGDASLVFHRSASPMTAPTIVCGAIAPRGRTVAGACATRHPSPLGDAHAAHSHTQGFRPCAKPCAKISSHTRTPAEFLVCDRVRRFAHQSQIVFHRNQIPFGRVACTARVRAAEPPSHTPGFPAL